MRLPLAFALVAATASSVGAGPKEDAYATVEAWAAAFSAHDAEKVVALYSPDALLFGTVSPSLTSKPEDVQAYFAASAKNKVSVKLGDHAAMANSDTVVTVTGLYDFSRDNGPALPARYTFVVVKSGDAWKIAHHHSSLRPKPPEPAKQ